MKGDFTRDSFKPEEHYTGVRLQQGRVLLDSDWNEQVDIVRHRLAKVMEDVVGKEGIPNDEAIKISIKPGKAGAFHLFPDFTVSKGSFYLDGVKYENSKEIVFSEQPFLQGASRRLKDVAKPGDTFVVFFEAWDQQVTHLEDKEILDSALQGHDITTRTQAAWQIGWLPVEEWDKQWAAEWSGKNSVAQLEVTFPEHIVENSLYRFEIHQGGGGNEAIFKWSRSNDAIAHKATPIVVLPVDTFNPRPALGQHISVTLSGQPEPMDFRVINVQNNGINLSTNDALFLQNPLPAAVMRGGVMEVKVKLGETETKVVKAKLSRLIMVRDSAVQTYGFRKGDWVELVSRHQDFSKPPSRLSKIKEVFPNTEGGVMLELEDANQHPILLSYDLLNGIYLLLRWDGEFSIKCAENGLQLKDGPMVKFDVNDKGFRRGDYWLVPARVGDQKTRCLNSKHMRLHRRKLGVFVWVNKQWNFSEGAELPYFATLVAIEEWLEKLLGKGGDREGNAESLAALRAHHTNLVDLAKNHASVMELVEKRSELVSLANESSSLIGLIKLAKRLERLEWLFTYVFVPASILIVFIILVALFMTS